MHTTKHSLPKQTRQAMVALLNQNLADCLDLAYQVKQAHWNLKGMNFIGLHKLFDELHESTEAYVDTMAERLTALGGQAHGTIVAAAKNSRLPEYDLEANTAQNHLELLTTAYAQFSKDLRAAIDDSGEAGDEATSDLFTEVIRGIDESLYFLEAHLQGPDGTYDNDEAED